jgi:NO-binding membrane sensor protein with MHYT domain/signal transduction histidine kinase
VQATYNSWLVALSILVAMLVAYTALKLAARVADAGRSGSGKLWLLGGAVAMGIGIWSMHFIGMLAFSVSIPLRYGIGKTLTSLAIAIATSGLALALASRPRLGLARLTVGAIAMGAGISAMHYSGMSAITIVPMISYEPWLVAASIGIAVAASFAALWLAFQLRSDASKHVSLARAAAAVVMGLAISGMHYTAMAASKFAPGSYCLGGAAIENDWLAVTIGIVALGMLVLTLITTIYDAHLGSQIRKDAERLARVNADLEHGKNLLALATRAAGISLWELDIAKRSITWTENEIASLTVGGVNLQRTPDAILTMTHPDDATIVFDAIREAVAQSKAVCHFRFRVVAPYNTIVHLEAHARIFCNERGEPVRALGVSWDVTDEVKQQEHQRELQAQLREASRDAGMAEVATGVLHSVGNVLNSLSVSAAMVGSKLHESRVNNIQRVASMLLEQGDRLGDFLTHDAKGRHIPQYLAQLGEHLLSENQALHVEAEAIAAHVGHIRTIVAAQQTHARRGGVTEQVDIADLVDNAVTIHFTATPEVTIKREYEALPPMILDRHKLLQILGNLLSNARHALKEPDSKEHTSSPRTLTLRIHGRAAGWFVVEVQDTGTGIAPDALKRIFEFGFTTKQDGHGFGLHSSAILAKELGGHLAGFSEGPGRGAQFALRLPLTSAVAIAKRSEGGTEIAA